MQGIIHPDCEIAVAKAAASLDVPLVMSTVAFVLISFVDKEGKLQPFAKDVDWRMAPAGLLILFAVWILAGLALLCSTRLEMVSTST